MTVAVARLDKELAWRTAILLLFLSWPLFLFGRPTYLPDSVGYLTGGRIAVGFVESKLAPRSELAHAAAPAGAIASRRPETKATRSGIYSATAWLLRAPGVSMIVLALAQAFAAAFVSAVTARAFGVNTARHFVVFSIVLASATTLAATAAFAIPDIFAGLLIAVCVLFVTRLDKLSTGVRLTLAAVGSFAVAAHNSHPPLAAGMALVGAGALFWDAGTSRHSRWLTLAWLTSPLLVGVIATAIVGLVAFGDASLAPKRFPLALARSVSDGPARWYLETECRTPRFAVCEVFGTDIPDSINGFLFAATGLQGRATSEQLDRIRAEESAVVIAAARRYPGTEALTLLRNMGRQLLRFDLSDTRFNERMILEAGTPRLLRAVGDNWPAVQIAGFLAQLAVALTIAWTAWNFRRLEPANRAAILLVTCGILGNAVICVVFSGIAERYHARVIWLLPLFVIAIALARRERHLERLAHPVRPADFEAGTSEQF